MVQLTDSYVDSLALNAGAMKNGKDLVKKNSFPRLCISEDKTLLFGQCQGSGKEPYHCSVDWTDPDSPVFRCSCPSRQFPCKHNLGLMYAFTAGKPFETAPIPQDIADKRQKAEQREEKKKEAATAKAANTDVDANNANAEPPKRKTNKSALVKKIAAQLEGIGIAEKLLMQLVQSGLGSLDKKTVQTVQDQAKQLGNHYIPGVQAALRDLTIQLQADVDRETLYTRAIERLPVLHALIRKSKSYLESRLHNPEAAADGGSTIEEWIGHAWQMAELRELGRVSSDAELLQLAFRSYTDEARGEFVDEGCWVDLQSGHIHMTVTYRPFRAAKYIREDDSLFQVVKTKELARYPGELNARIRWEDFSLREASSQDWQAVFSSARTSIPEAVKAVKNQIKNPLSDKHPVMLLRFDAIAQAEAGSYVLQDEQNRQLPLADIAHLNEGTTHLLPMLNRTLLKRQAMLVMFEHNEREGTLTAQPLTIITPQGSVRLLY